MEKKIWNKENYNIFLNDLYKKGDRGYKEFHSSLGIDNSYLIGISSPILKEYAKEISNTDYISFIKHNTHKTYEERMIHGLLLGYIKEDFKVIISMLKDFIPYIDNWALCDATAANLKIMRKNLVNGFPFVLECLNNENMWYQRVGFVLLLDYYINDEYIDRIFELCNRHKTDEHYVKMAIAWLISVAYVKYPVQTNKFLKANNLSPWIQNKAIQKIRESRRVSNEEKEKLKLWKK